MKRLEALKDALDQATQEAELEKHQHRLQQLRKGGHDTSHLEGGFKSSWSLIQQLLHQSHECRLCLFQPKLLHGSILLTSGATQERLWSLLMCLDCTPLLGMLMLVFQP